MSLVSANWKKLQETLKTKDKTSTSPVTEENLWFDVKPADLQRSVAESKAAELGTTVRLIELFPKAPSSNHRSDAGKYVAIDCEMVGVGNEGIASALARVSLVNWHGQVLLDKYVRPLERITDYRTDVSGIKSFHLRDALTLFECQKLLQPLLDGKILVGHGLVNDFKVLLMSHPRRLIRDTTKYHGFRKAAGGKTPSLKKLTEKFLGVRIQAGEHDSVEDARATMLLYRMIKDDWERILFEKIGKKRPIKKKDSVVSKKI